MRSPAALCTTLLALLAVGWAAAQDVIGAPTSYVTTEQDTLLDIAWTYDLGYVEIRAANPGVDPWLPGAGRVLALPTLHVLPDAPRRGIVINLPELRLYYFPTKGPPYSFPIGVGREGFETPIGRTAIVAKRAHPSWTPTRSEHAEDPDLPASVPPGPENPMGEYALYLGWKGYAIHGTNQPYSVGRRGSHGCIRLYPEDIEQLYRLVPVGAPVVVVDQPVKAGWLGDVLYLQVHPEQFDADWLESEGRSAWPGAAEAEPVAIRAAGRFADRLDWYAIGLAEDRRTGMAVPVLSR